MIGELVLYVCVQCAVHVCLEMIQSLHYLQVICIKEMTAADQPGRHRDEITQKKTAHQLAPYAAATNVLWDCTQSVLVYTRILVVLIFEPFT